MGRSRATGFWLVCTLLCAWVVSSGCRREARRTPPAQPSPAAAAHRDILGIKKRQGKILYSQHDEELIIRDFFQDRRDGVFLDVGCAWPEKDSNTYFLETKLGWSGIGVDALPEFAPAWARERPRSRFFNYIATDHSGDFQTFYRAPNIPGISSVKPRETYSRHKVKYEEIRVPTITLTKLLDDNHVARIDLLSMDVEGAELLALSGFDIDRFRPELVCIEYFNVGEEKLRGYFTAHGYERLDRYLPYDGANEYFTPKAAEPRPAG
jgi:FkbM family methyltransferase